MEKSVDTDLFAGAWNADKRVAFEFLRSKKEASPCSGLLIRKHGDEKRRWRGGKGKKKEKRKEGRKEEREREGGSERGGVII